MTDARPSSSDLPAFPKIRPAGAMREAVKWPEGVKRGGGLLSKLGKLAPDIVGSEPVRLAQILQDALTPFEIPSIDSGLDDIVLPDDRAEFERSVALAEKALVLLVKVAPGADKLFLEAEAASLSWLQNVDHLLVAALRTKVTGVGIDPAEAARRLAAAARLLAGLSIEVQPKSTPGSKPVIDAAYFAVRATCYYLDHVGMPLEGKWKRVREEGAERDSPFSDSEIIPISADAILLTKVFEICGIDAAYVTIQGLQRRFLQQLQREARKPNRADFMPAVLADSD